jgi:hypothetical protein
MRTSSWQKTDSRAYVVFALWPALAMLGSAGTFARAASPALRTLYSFQGGSDGQAPFVSAMDSGGVLYGATSQGGTGSACHGGCGTVFSLNPPSSAGGAWTKTVLYSFSGGSDGQPTSGLLLRSGPGGQPVLYGATGSGGASNAGTVYSLTPPSISGGPWIKTVLYGFKGSPDGANPIGIAMDAAGVLFGTARSGGEGSACAGGCGALFSLIPATSPTGTWTEQVLYSFTGGNNGFGPGAIAIDGGVLYGATTWGGTYNNGTVFSLTPPASAGGVWTQAVLASFHSVFSLVIGSGGVLYGNTLGGGTYNGGTVFSLAPPASPGGAWTQTILHSFATCPFSSSCVEPTGLYYADKTGALYGVTIFGGTYRAGSVYSLRPASAGQSWTYSVLHSFNQTDGADPDSLVLRGGMLYGATAFKGSGTAGTVFSLQP